MTCKDCMFSTDFRDPNDLRARKRQCRRMPPHPVAFPVHQGPAVAIQQLSLSPVVDEGYWCGEYRAQERTEA